MEASDNVARQPHTVKIRSHGINNNDMIQYRYDIIPIYINWIAYFVSSGEGRSVWDGEV